MEVALARWNLIPKWCMVVWCHFTRSTTHAQCFCSPLATHRLCSERGAALFPPFLPSFTCADGPRGGKARRKLGVKGFVVSFCCFFFFWFFLLLPDRPCGDNICIRNGSGHDRRTKGVGLNRQVSGAVLAARSSLRMQIWSMCLCRYTT